MPLYCVVHGITEGCGCPPANFPDASEYTRERAEEDHRSVAVILGTLAGVAKAKAMRRRR